jgi:hypothetical protein
MFCQLENCSYLIKYFVFHYFNVIKIGCIAQKVLSTVVPKFGTREYNVIAKWCEWRFRIPTYSCELPHTNLFAQTLGLLWVVNKYEVSLGIETQEGSEMDILFYNPF